MPAKLVVLSGAEQGKELWIEKVVVRLGRSPGCELVLGDAHLPEHAATLEFRDGQYNLYSRLEEPVILGGRTLPARGFDRWPAGKELQLPGPILLRLDVERDPRPAPKPRPSPMVGTPEPSPGPGGYEPSPADDLAKADEGAKKRSRQFTQFMIILLCAGAGVFFFFMEEQGTGPTIKSPAKELESLVVKINKEKAGEPRYVELRESLQAARTAELRGNSRVALTHYKRLRDELVRWKNSANVRSEDEGKFLDRTLRFVVNRLEATTVAEE